MGVPEAYYLDLPQKAQPSGMASKHLRDIRPLREGLSFATHKET
jgi:hypothetical protein